jgi:hypothetical protein
MRITWNGLMCHCTQFSQYLEFVFIPYSDLVASIDHIGELLRVTAPTVQNVTDRLITNPPWHCTDRDVLVRWRNLQSLRLSLSRLNGWSNLDCSIAVVLQEVLAFTGNVGPLPFEQVHHGLPVRERLGFVIPVGTAVGVRQRHQEQRQSDQPHHCVLRQYRHPCAYQ